MPKPLHKIDIHCLDRLKSELELRVGINLKNRSDCQRMSNRIPENIRLATMFPGDMLGFEEVKTSNGTSVGFMITL